MQKQQLQTRLRRIEGQVRGVARMIDEDKYCVDVVAGRGHPDRPRPSLGCSTATSAAASATIKAGGGEIGSTRTLEVMDRVLRR
jgi:hypothetical protein